jgi:hypothetical protein
MASSPENVDCSARSGGVRARSARGAAKIFSAVLCAAAVALALPTLASASYGWPIKPFDREHPVRGQLNDPRMNGSDFYSSSSHTFHFGLDIAVPDGTAVYAVAPGFVHYLSSDAITVHGYQGVSTFAYWHVRPIVKNGKKVKLHALLGYVEPGRGHVHFGEKRGGCYVNPLRRGALTPYSDTTAPTIASLSYYDGTYHELEGATISATVGLTVNAFDRPQLRSTWPWAVVTPAWIGWQLVAASGQAISSGHWDLGSTLCSINPFGVFAPGTSKNSSYGAGAYNYWLGAQWDTSRVANGTYSLFVTVANVRGNKTTKIVSFSVANDPATVTTPSL